MKRAKRVTPIWLLISGLVLAINCRTGNIEVIKPFVGTETCTADSAHKYSVFIPSHPGGCKSIPLVIILDPQGSGSFAIKHFIQAAEKYKCALVASHLIRNNYSSYVQSMETLIADAKQKFNLGEKIFIAGFSGGARMALTYAQFHHVNGVLACGALGPSDQLSALKTNVYALTGIADFNFPEVATYILNKDSKPSFLQLELAGEKHQWPSPSDISRGLGNLIFNNADKNSLCLDLKSELDNLSDSYKKTGDSLFNRNLLINAGLLYENALKVKDIPSKHHFRKQLDAIEHDQNMKEQMAGLQKSLQFEFKVRDAYFNALKVRDKAWWANELKDIDAHISENTDYMMQNAYKRIKAFLGIVCYSLTNNALRAHDMATADKILQVYRLLEPENPDMLYFTALYELKNGKHDEVKRYLKKALEAGYSNIELLRSDFPENYLNELYID